MSIKFVESGLKKSLGMMEAAIDELSAAIAADNEPGREYAQIMTFCDQVADIAIQAISGATELSAKAHAIMQAANTHKPE